MSKPDKSTITIQRRNSEETITFRATKYENTTVVSVEGPVRMVLDQIKIEPSDHSGDRNSDCGVALNYTRTSKFDTHLASHVVIPPEEESKLVEWLYNNDADFIIVTDEYRDKRASNIYFQGRCANCQSPHE